MSNLIKNALYNRTSAKLVNWLYGLGSKTQNYIFVATTGRSGTLSLVDIFDQLDDCTALHEPYPAMHDNILDAASNGQWREVEEFYWVRKSVNIRRSARHFKYYLEANHLFIKTFADYAFTDFQEKIKVIHLVRDPRKVANSIYTLQDQPGTEEGNRWWLNHLASSNIIPIGDILENDETFQHPYYKALWYWFELEKRVEAAQAKHPEVPFIFFKTEDFSKPEKVSNLLKELGITANQPFIDQATRTKSHDRSHQKKIAPLPEADTNLFLGKFVELMCQQKIQLPKSYYEYQ